MGKYRCPAGAEAGTIYTVDQLEADPIASNSNLGTYTKFPDLLDLSAIAVPNGFGPLGLPLGITLIAPAFHDRALAALGARWQQTTGLKLGTTKAECPPPKASRAPSSGIRVAVVGGHMEGMPLNGELQALVARKLAATHTEPVYRLYALSGFNPPRPGLLRVADGEGHGSRPRSGKYRRTASANPSSQSRRARHRHRPDATYRSREGLPVRSMGTTDAEDISHYGGWRAYAAERSGAR